VIPVIIGGLFVVFSVFPIPYIFYKKGRQKFLFVSSVIGAVTIVELLLFLLVLPIIPAMIFLFPGLEELGYLENISFLIHAAEFVADNYFWLLSWLNVVLSIAIFRKYEIFNHTHNNRMQPDAAKLRR